MNKIKTYLIHLLGGVTPEEQEGVSDLFYRKGLDVAKDNNNTFYTKGQQDTLRFVKGFVEHRYGTDWRDALYKVVCRHLDLHNETT